MRGGEEEEGAGVFLIIKFHFFYHFLTDWFNAVSILLSVQYHQSIQYNVVRRRIPYFHDIRSFPQVFH